MEMDLDPHHKVIVLEEDVGRKAVGQRQTRQLGRPASQPASQPASLAAALSACLAEHTTVLQITPKACRNSREWKGLC